MKIFILMILQQLFYNCIVYTICFSLCNSMFNLIVKT